MDFGVLLFLLIILMFGGPICGFAYDIKGKRKGKGVLKESDGTMAALSRS